MAILHPSNVSLDADEVYRVNRVHLALLLHKFPHEIDATVATDIEDMIAVYNIEQDIARRQGKG